MNHGPIWAAAAILCLIGQTAVVLQASCEASVGDHLLVNCTNRGPHISVTWSQWQPSRRGNDKATPVRLLSESADYKWAGGKSKGVPSSTSSHRPSCCSLRVRKRDHKPREGNEDRKPASPSCVSSLPNEASPSHTDADARVDPLGLDLLQFMPGDFSVVTCQGSNVTMVCDVQGQGTSVSWKRRSHTDIANVHLFQGDTLELEDVKKEDGGFYVCEVVGSDSHQPVITRELILSVEYPPVISVPATEVRGSSSHSCRLHCVVEAFPEAIVTWYKDDVLLDDTSDVRYQTVLETNGNCTLRAILLIRIPNDTNSANDSSSENENASPNFGNYSCVAENKHGRTSAVLKLVAPNVWDSRIKDEEEEEVEPRRFNVTGFIIGMMPPIFISFYIILKLGYRSRYAQEHPEDDGGREEPFFVSY